MYYCVKNFYLCANFVATGRYDCTIRTKHFLTTKRTKATKDRKIITFHFFLRDLRVLRGEIDFSLVAARPGWNSSGYETQPE
jgi:hypothetical protein